MSESKYINKSDEMKLYNEMHKIALLQNYIMDENIGPMFSDEHDINKVELAKNICSKNLCNIEYGEKNILASKCISEKKIDMELLKFELKYLPVTTVNYMELDDFKLAAKALLKKYQWKAGGYYIEDIDWITHKKGSKYSLGANQLVLENTIDTSDCHSEEFVNFMKKILNILNNMANNIDVRIKYETSKTDSLTWIIIKCSDNTRNEKKVEL
jgi:hypothetical protein